MNKYYSFPNNIWTIEVTEVQTKQSDLDSVIEQLQKHITKPRQICIVQIKTGGYTVLRKLQENEKPLTIRRKKDTKIGRIVKVI